MYQQLRAASRITSARRSLDRYLPFLIEDLQMDVSTLSDDIQAATTAAPL